MIICVFYLYFIIIFFLNVHYGDRIRHFKEQVKLREEETTKWNLRYNLDEIAAINNILLFFQSVCRGHVLKLQDYLR